VALLEAAKEWGVPPWVIEDEISLEWWERWRVLQEERAKTQQAKAPKQGKGKAKIMG
jgi:hypothetical protein